MLLLSMAVAQATPMVEDFPFAHFEAILAPIPKVSQQDDPGFKALVTKLEKAREVEDKLRARCLYDAVMAVSAGTAVNEASTESETCIADALKPVPKGVVNGKSKVHRNVESDRMTIESRSTVVKVFYGTDRKGNATDGYGGTPRCMSGGGSQCIEYGVAHVNIPASHRLGHVETPALWTIYPDDQRHLFIRETESMDPGAWTSALKGGLAAASGDDVFVFIHGYNNSFEDAAHRTAQIAYDLKFPGVPAMFSWSSQGTLRGYFTDEKHVKAAGPQLHAFLKKVGRESGSKSIHVVAHSMGNRALADVIDELAGDSSLNIESITLAAPDIDAEVFANEIAPQLPSAAKRASVYVSANDHSLQASHLIHGDIARAGEVRRTYEGVVTIDASSVTSGLTGHSYYGSVPRLLQDMHEFWAGRGPGKRSWLEAAEDAIYTMKP